MPINLKLGRLADALSNATNSARSANGLRVRKIVTVSGRGPRGPFPSFKASERLQYESLVEEDALRVLEVASSASMLRTQPEVLVLNVQSEQFRYTPDVALSWNGASHFLEVKGNHFVKSTKTVKRLWQIRTAMRAAGLSWSLVLESDLRAGGLQVELKDLLRMRPVPGRQRNDLDYRAWDPLNGVPPDDVTGTRWARAKVECDALLKRVMHRDPGDLLPVLQN
jgi:hypothetical protein